MQTQFSTVYNILLQVLYAIKSQFSLSTYILWKNTWIYKENKAKNNLDDMDVGIVNGYCQLQFTALLTSSVFCRTVTCVAKNEKYETTTFCRELIKMNISRTSVFSYRTRFANKTFYFGTGTFFCKQSVMCPKKEFLSLPVSQKCKLLHSGIFVYSLDRWG